MKTSLIAALVLAPGALLASSRPGSVEPPAAFAPEPSGAEELDVVRVTQTGTVRLAPSHVGLKATLATKAASAAAALEAHHKLRERAIAGMRAAGVEVFDLESGGLRVQLEQVDPNQRFNNVVIVNGQVQQPDSPDRPFECLQELTFFVVPGEDAAATADILALAHDTAKDLGLELGPRPDIYGRVVSMPGQPSPLETLTYRVADDAHLSALAEAERRALEAARLQARRLTAWSGRALGGVRVMQAGEPKVTWSGLGAEVEVSVTATVTFALER